MVFACVEHHPSRFSYFPLLEMKDHFWSEKMRTRQNKTAFAHTAVGSVEKTKVQ